MPTTPPFALPQSPDPIDWDRMRVIARRNRVWILLLFIACNLAAYLMVRYTKPVYESESELKLDVKRDASEFGLKQLVDEPNVNLISGEIEQIKSRLFLNRVIDSLPVQVSYFSVGKILTYELYTQSPFRVTYSLSHSRYFNQPVFFEWDGPSGYRLQLPQASEKVKGVLGQPLQLDGLTLTITETSLREPQDRNEYYFVINDRAYLLDYFIRNVKVEPLNPAANTIRVSFRDYNVLKARDIVNKIDSLYIYYSNEQKSLATRQKIEWLNQELAQIEEKLESFEDYFERFILQNRSNNLDRELQQTVAAINKIDSQRYEANIRANQLAAVIHDLGAPALGGALRTYSFLPESLNRQLEQLQKLAIERDRLSLAYNENTLAYQQKQQQYETARTAILHQLEAAQKNWIQQMSVLNQRKNQLEQRFAAMPDKNTQFAKNQRFYKLYEEFYLAMMQSKAEFEIAQAGTTPDFKILSPANVSPGPISPKKYLIMAIGLSGGLFLSVLFVSLIYLFRPVITTVNEVERASALPVVASIPLSPKRAERIYVVENPRSLVSEAIRALRTNLDFFSSEKKSKTIAITSSVSGEGKSFLSLNLSAVLASAQKKVLLIDLDLRKVKQHTFAQYDPLQGMSTVLIRKHTWRECIVPTVHENLFFLPAGPPPPNPSELLSNGLYGSLLQELQKEYDYIVMDTPPVGLVTDGTMVMKQSDIVLFVLRANYSRKDFLHQLSRTVTLHKIKSIALVVNAVLTEVSAYGKGYYEEEEVDWWDKIKIWR